ncbi:SMI1/KNR4 family protein [Pontibacter sp. Tf4]|uniref:SMI1/KNR4 family protein n=1 Tax=Pontibacter sp. Tf4 TaxID=2761620 RepID=UPI00162912C8|nr:SMI1/KNR4 family protein [Pontibacter sp. Tf4]MBB6611541.1 SMI1/KNR4 family protein [Pontibacter sp. Tf4]
MRRNIINILSRLDLNSAPSKTDMELLIQKIDFKIDDDYIEFIKNHNGASGDLSESNYILLWEAKDVVQLNPYYEGVEESDKLLFIGSDGGNLGYAVDKESSEFVEIDFLEIAHSKPTKVADSFEGLLKYLGNDSVDNGF